MYFDRRYTNKFKLEGCIGKISRNENVSVNILSSNF